MAVNENIFTARKRSLRRLCFYRCLSVHTGGGMHGFIWGRGMCGFIWEAYVVLFRGGMHSFIWGACMVLFGGHAWFYLGHAWFYLGACMVLIGGCMVLFGGHAWFFSGGMHGFSRGVYMVFLGRHAWFFQFFGIQWDMVNERAVRILLECILVYSCLGKKILTKHKKNVPIDNHYKTICESFRRACSSYTVC